MLDLGYSSANPDLSVATIRTPAGSSLGGTIVTINGDNFVESSRCPVATSPTSTNGYMKLNPTATLTACRWTEHLIENISNFLVFEQNEDHL